MSDLKRVAGSSYVVESVRNDSDESTIAKRIKSFGLLPIGWWGGEGVPATDRSVQVACRIASLAPLRHVEVNAFPEPEGGVIVKFYRNEYIVEVNVARDGSLSYVVEEGLGPDFDVLLESGDTACEGHVSQLVTALGQGCDLSEFYPRTHTIPALDDLIGPRSRPFVVGSPYSMEIVQ